MMKQRMLWGGMVILALGMGFIWLERNRISSWFASTSDIVVAVPALPPLASPPQEFDVRQRLAQAAMAQIGVTVHYDPAYIRLAYPGGDVPPDRGVCSDVVVRAFRAVGWDLQVLVHEDMTTRFASYPTRWGMRRPDANIDHRRVLNLMTWFDHQRWAVPISASPDDYRAGDIVAWDLGRGLTHIGVVVTDDKGGRFIVHNIGQGAKREDVLFAWRQIGHYRIARENRGEDALR
jgi:uncharacterized protein YijF (DUF1287 family)